MARWKKKRRSDERMIVWRNRRAYGDFRAFNDVGGGQEALSEPGNSWGTKDEGIAQALHDERLEELKAVDLGQPWQQIHCIWASS